MNMIEIYGNHHLEHILEHLASGVTIRYELWFIDKNGLKYGHRYFHNQDVLKDFINNDKFQKALKDGNFKENVFFDSEENRIIWKYRK